MIAPTITAYPFANPLFPPVYHPPVAARIEEGTQQPRIVSDVIDIGAFEAKSSKVRFTKNTVDHNKILQTYISDDYFIIYNLLGNRLRKFTTANASSVIIIDGVTRKQSGIRAFYKYKKTNNCANEEFNSVW